MSLELKPEVRSITLLVISLTTPVLILASIGEERPDAYVAVEILAYYIVTIIDPLIRRIAKLTIIDLILMLIFIAIVIYRVMEII
ncbi:MAG: hypothetical protein QXQ91_00580 [Nanopusillaceae archaeon]